MTKFLLALLIVITGLKLFDDSSALVSNDAAAGVFLHDDEGRSGFDVDENGKEDTEEIEELFYTDHTAQYALIKAIMIFQSAPGHYTPHSGFADKPYIPPDVIL